MAKIRPFRGWRYSQNECKGDLSTLTSLPYDVLSHDERNSLVEEDEHNVVALELPEGSDDPASPDSKHANSKAIWDQWASEGVLEQDSEPAIYMLEQRFTHADASGNPVNYARKSFIVEMDLYDFDEKVVLPHELTLPKALGDRYALLSATNINYSSVLGLFSDNTPEYDEIIEQVHATQPVAFANRTSCNNITESSLWKITDKNIIERIVGMIGPKQIFIADGHHRYTVALAWRDKCREMAAANGTTGSDEDEEAPKTDMLMVALTNMDDPQLLVLPYHRAVRLPEGEKLDAVAFLEELGERTAGVLAINVLGKALSGSDTYESDKSELLDAMDGFLGRAQTPAFGIVARDASGAIRFATAEAEPSANLEDAIVAEHSPAWKELDVSVLHELVIAPFFGISPKEPESLSRISYTSDAGKLLGWLEAGRADVAFVMRPTKLSQLRDVSLAGDTMPQKSTFFYPKLPSGFVFRNMA